MDHFERWIWVVIPILWLAVRPFRAWIGLKERQMEIAAKSAGEEAVRYAARIERLESRVAVLERIVTDRGQNLADEIEALRVSSRLN